MWIFTPEGFFSVVEKGDPNYLCVRAWAADDLDRLRDTYLPSLGATIEHAGTDYAFRAYAAREAVAEAMAAAVRAISWSNFKDVVRERRGPEREDVYHSVWATMLRLEPPLAKPIPSMWGHELDDWEDDWQVPWRSTLCRVCGERVAVLRGEIDINATDEELLAQVERLGDVIAKECEFNDTGFHDGFGLEALA